MANCNSEPVRLAEKRYGFLPAAFIWRGRRYDVRRVERSWTEARGAGAGRLERRYFRVHCDHGAFDLCHDLLANTWSVSARIGLRRPAVSWALRSGR